MATKPFDAPERNGLILLIGAAAAATLYAGVIGAVNAAGNAVPASDTAGLRVIGRVQLDVFNAGGAAGDLSAQIKRGCFRWANSEAEPVTAADVGKYCFVEDDTTVAMVTDHFVKAGRIVAVDDNGVWVDTSEILVIPTVVVTTSAQNATAAAVDLATAEALANALKENYNALQTDFVALKAACDAARITA